MPRQAWWIVGLFVLALLALPGVAPVASASTPAPNALASAVTSPAPGSIASPAATPVQAPIATTGDAAAGDPPTARSSGLLHGNHVTVGNQVVGDGRVLVESAALLSEGFVAVHRETDGSRGAVLGYAPVSLGTHTGIEVPVETDDLPSEENVTLRAVLYGDDGDGEFDAESDRVLTSFGSPAEESFSARAGDGSVSVVAASLQGRPSTGSVTLERVALDRPGYVVLRSDRELEPDVVVGWTRLDAGTHRNVTVDVDDDFFTDQDERFYLWAVAHADDGDGQFDDADRPITVGGDPVASRFAVLRVDDGGTDSTGGVNTPGSTVAVNTPESGAGVETPDGTTADGATTTPDASTTTTDSPGSSGGIPLGLVFVVFVISAVVGFLLSRRR